jgi:hypothetical protein
MSWVPNSYPSVFARVGAKSLILLISQDCLEIEQASAEPAESRLWRYRAPVAHKVIHSICEQSEKRFPIINLGVFSEMNPSFPAQLALPVG